MTIPGNRPLAGEPFDLDEIRNVFRCGTYNRIRQAIKAAAAEM